MSASRGASFVNLSKGPMMRIQMRAQRLPYEPFPVQSPQLSGNQSDKPAHAFNASTRNSSLQI